MESELECASHAGAGLLRFQSSTQVWESCLHFPLPLAVAAKFSAAFSVWEVLVTALERTVGAAPEEGSQPRG